MPRTGVTCQYFHILLYCGHAGISHFNILQGRVWISITLQIVFNETCSAIDQDDEPSCNLFISSSPILPSSLIYFLIPSSLYSCISFILNFLTY